MAGSGILTRAKEYINLHRHHIIRFLLVGSTAAALNIGLMYVLVEFCEFNTLLLKNVANLLSMETSVVYNFMLSRGFTWSDTPRYRGWRLLLQLIGFHSAIGIGLLLRLALFPVLQQIGVSYIPNVVLGISAAAIIDFFIYNHIIFKSKAANE